MMRRSRLTQGGAAIALMMLVGGCAQADAVGGSPVADEAGDGDEYLCQGTPVPASVLTDGATADQLGEEAAAALDGASVPDIEPEQWRVLTETDTKVYLVRELPEPRDSDGEQVACASGEPAAGRVTLERLMEHEDRVELVIGVETPPGDGQTCPSNPPTPFTVELDEPLGARALVDVAVYPERELAAAAAE